MKYASVAMVVWLILGLFCVFLVRGGSDKTESPDEPLK